MHLRQPDLSLLLVEHLHKETKKEYNIKETGDLRYIHQNELYETFFQYDMAYGACKDLPRRAASSKVLYDKTFSISSNP